MAKGISELMDVIDLLEELIDFIVEAKEDGAVDWRDLPEAMTLFFPAMKALDNCSEAIEELKDLDEAEAVEFCTALVQLIRKLMLGV